MTNFRKVEGTALIIRGICEDIITKSEIISDDAHDIAQNRLATYDNDDIVKSYQKIGNYIKDLQKFDDFLHQEMQDEFTTESKDS